jgi:hypothetical protein
MYTRTTSKICIVGAISRVPVTVMVIEWRCKLGERISHLGSNTVIILKRASCCYVVLGSKLSVCYCNVALSRISVAKATGPPRAPRTNFSFRESSGHEE